MAVKDYAGKLVFKINGNDFRAAGFCFYTKDKIMLQKGIRGWEFPGGRVDEVDKSILDTAIRESVEETNGNVSGRCGNLVEDEKFFRSYINNQKNGKVHWIPDYRFKYGLFFLEVPDDWVLPDNDYGEKEVYENIERTIHWVSFDRFKDIIDNDDTFLVLKMKTFIKQQILLWLDNNTPKWRYFYL